MQHSLFIAGAWGVTLLIVSGLIARAVIDARIQRRALADLEARGAGRRSGRAPS